MNVIDILILVVIVLSALQGYRKGLINGLGQFAGIIIGFFVASLEYINVLKWLEQTFPLQRWLEPQVYKLVLPSLQSQTGTITQQSIERLLEIIPAELRNSFASGNLIEGSAATITQSYIEQAARNISGLLTEKILALLTFVLILLVIIAIVRIIVTILFAPLGIFKGVVNRGGGLLFGGLCAFLSLAVISGIFLPIIKLDVQNSGLMLLQQSIFLPYLLQTFQMLSQVFSLQLVQTSLNIIKCCFS
ncbi:MAG: CvpA family protein [Desulfitobacteriaceae bacterium]|nr:CvpA family protein [Desulfitobacteriaceae bacterium]MDD4345354.1 CvpA family protein [Desulfitobacteriaceae bacterium]MDD4400323.1 CvpA family protein [Desulfitobacteriaceae bacterium]